MSTTILLPDILSDSNWPSRRALNPHYEAVAITSTQWVESFHVFSPKAQVTFNRCNFPLIASLAYPYVDHEHLRLTSDIMYWYFVLDELSDIRDGASVREMVKTIKYALKDPHAPLPAGSSVIGDMTKCLWSRINAFSAESSARRFTDKITRYVEAVCVEAEDRERGFVRNIEEYLIVRRDTAAVRACLAFLMLPHDISDEVMSHPSIHELTEGTADLLIFVNDIYSYDFERRHGQDGHNLISAIMQEKKCDVQSAFDHAGEMFHRTAQRVLADSQRIPAFSPSVDRMLLEYWSGLKAWVIGLYEWGFESERYFGKHGQEVRESRIVQLSRKPSDRGERRVPGAM